jgi:hypothetical protein
VKIADPKGDTFKRVQNGKIGNVRYIETGYYNKSDNWLLSQVHERTVNITKIKKKNILLIFKLMSVYS